MGGAILHLSAGTAAAAAAASLPPLPPLCKLAPESRDTQEAAATSAAAAGEGEAAAAGEAPAAEKPPSTDPSLRRPPSSLRSLCRYLVEDAVAAGSASLCVSPAVTLIDRAVVVAATGHSGLLNCLCEGASSAVRQPWLFLRSQPFAAVFAVYAGTYFAANSAETLAVAFGANVASAKFMGTTACNITLCIRKDVIFSRLFGGPSWPVKKGPFALDRNYGIWGPPSGWAPLSERGALPSGSAAKPFPRTSAGLFLVRDGLTIAAAFNAPPYFAGFLSRWAGEEGQRKTASGALLRTRGAPVYEASCQQASTVTERLHATQQQDALQQEQQEQQGGVLLQASSRGPQRGDFLLQLQERFRKDPEVASFLAHLLSPVLVQFVSTPLHLLSLDLYNRPTGHSGPSPHSIEDNNSR
ncbi:hypothetical protein Esti_001487 [Eimeria stiedai]